MFKEDPMIANRPVNGHHHQKAANTKRIGSIDLLRGLVMIIMTLDHVRDYFHRDAFLYDPTNLQKTTIFLFFTRWITHFCAPIFIFLAGISARLYGERKGRRELAFFLLSRGIWLVFAEFFIVTLGWTFNPLYPVFNLQVLWATGLSMIVFAALTYLPRPLILFIALALIGGHNLLDNIHISGNGPSAIAWGIFHDGGDFTIGHSAIFIHYPLLPWIGVMAAGYCAGYLFGPARDATYRKLMLILLGMLAINLFFIIRALNGYGDPVRWSGKWNMTFTVLSFLNVTKYPPSLLYLLMTLGPAMLILAFFEKFRIPFGKKLLVFGRVPMFYYLAHIYLIHLLAIPAAAISIHSASAMVFLSNRVSRVPQLKGYGFDLPVVYIIWIAVLLLLYPLCKWFDRYKQKNAATHWWLRYL
jgi:uncharacterized membrane protein